MRVTHANCATIEYSARCSDDSELIEFVALANIHYEVAIGMRTADRLTSRPVALCLFAFLAFQSMMPSPAAQSRRLASAHVSAGQRKPAPKSSGSRAGAPARNSQISKLVKEIDPRNIENTIRKLVSFGTRNTLSEQDNPNRGIGAARDWLYGEFQKVAAASAGRMTVEKQTFEQPKGPRVPQPTTLTNIVETLKG